MRDPPHPRPAAHRLMRTHPVKVAVTHRQMHPRPAAGPSSAIDVRVPWVCVRQPAGECYRRLESWPSIHSNRVVSRAWTQFYLSSATRLPVESDNSAMRMALRRSNSAAARSLGHRLVPVRFEAHFRSPENRSRNNVASRGESSRRTEFHPMEVLLSAASSSASA